MSESGDFGQRREEHRPNAVAEHVDGQTEREALNGPMPLHKTIDKINIYLLNSPSSFSKVYLPEYINKNISKFISKGRPVKFPFAFSCSQFIDYVYDKFDQYEYLSLSQKKWHYIPFEQDKLTTGTVIYLSKHGTCVHAALYFGRNQYLSLFGCKGSIMWLIYKNANPI